MKSLTSICIVPTENFKKEAKILSKKYLSFEDDLEEVIKDIYEKPRYGISLGHNCYKIRFAIKSKNSGKSGGARLVTLVKIVNNTVYLLSVFDKSHKDSVSDSELAEIIKEIHFI
ncbi:MAG: type II toxin-antitoxin system RelE/ParE family toxin [bacterium]